MWREYSPHIAGQDNSIFLLVLAVILVFLFQERCECNMQVPGDARRLTEKDGMRKADPKKSESGKRNRKRQAVQGASLKRAAYGSSEEENRIIDKQWGVFL